MTKVFTFHKATIGLNRFVDTITLKLKKQTHAETNPHPDFFVEGREIAALLYDYLPGSTIIALRDHLNDLCIDKPSHGVVSADIVSDEPTLPQLDSISEGPIEGYDY